MGLGIKVLRHERIVLGLGSNVVDHVMRVRAAPVPNFKAFLVDGDSNEKPIQTMAGGVVLNQLAWMSALTGGAQCGLRPKLLAVQGSDAGGKHLREEIKRQRIDDSAVVVDSTTPTAFSHVYVDPSGDRTIIMHRGATAQLSPSRVESLWRQAYSNAAAAGPESSTNLALSEISQVPLPAVSKFFELSRGAGMQCALDFDIAPGDALLPHGAARLGHVHDLRSILSLCNILKIGASAAPQLIKLLGAPEHVTEQQQQQQQQQELRLQEMYSASKLDSFAIDLMNVAPSLTAVLITAGSFGSAARVRFSTQNHERDCTTSRCTTEFGAFMNSMPVDSCIDTTGAGDAWFGAFLAWCLTHGNGHAPSTPTDLNSALHCASKCAALSCTSSGGLPPDGAPIDAIRSEFFRL